MLDTMTHCETARNNKTVWTFTRLNSIKVTNKTNLNIGEAEIHNN